MTPKTFEELFSNYENYLNTKGITTGDETNFSEFLTESGYSDNHVTELFNHYTNKTEPTFDIPEKEIKARGINTIPRKLGRFFLKKALPAAIITGAVAGTTLAGFASSVIPAGSNFLWMTMGSNAALNFATIAVETGVIAALANVGYFAGRYKYKTKKYSSDKSLVQLSSNVDIKNTNLAKLMQKIETTEQEILNLREGKWFTAPYRWVKSKILLTNNAVRNLYVQKAYKELMAKFYNKLNDQEATNEQKYNDSEMKSIKELLKLCKSHIDADIEKSLVYALLNCKENDKHSHKIENADIYSEMQIYEDSIRKIYKDRKINSVSGPIYKNLVEQSAKTRTHNRSDKHNITTNLVNRKTKLLSETLEEYDNLAPVVVTPVAPTPTIQSWEVFYKGTKFALDNGKFLIVSGINSSEIESATYSGSSIKEIRITFNTSALDSIVNSGKELTKSAIDKIIQRRSNLNTIYHYIQTPGKQAELIANIPTTKVKLANLLTAIQTSFNTSADFKLSGAASTLYNKVAEEYRIDTGHILS